MYRRGLECAWEGDGITGAASVRLLGLFVCGLFSRHEPHALVLSVLKMWSEDHTSGGANGAVVATRLLCLFLDHRRPQALLLRRWWREFRGGWGDSSARGAHQSLAGPLQPLLRLLLHRGRSQLSL